MKKRIIAAALVIVLSMTALLACSSKDDQGETIQKIPVKPKRLFLSLRR